VEEMVGLRETVLCAADISLLDIGVCTRKIISEPHIRRSAGL
jgi:hypothetical protein